MRIVHFTLVFFNLCFCASHRDADGAYVPIHKKHYKNGEHNSDFDHASILGSEDAAEEYSHLPPEESKRRLGLLAKRMDINSDGHVDKKELQIWIEKSFKDYSKEESNDRFVHTDKDNNKCVSWKEHLAEKHLEDPDEVDPEDVFPERKQSDEEDRQIFTALDKNNDICLDEQEYYTFTHPEEHPEIIPMVTKVNLDMKDKNKDGSLSFEEYAGDVVDLSDEEIASEKEQYISYDKNKDGLLDVDEYSKYLTTDNEEFAEEEVEHLFKECDDDKDGVLTFMEIVDHHETFVGSEATSYGDKLNDEL